MFIEPRMAEFGGLLLLFLIMWKFRTSTWNPRLGSIGREDRYLLSWWANQDNMNCCIDQMNVWGVSAARDRGWLA
jgi:hypothetical protein